MGLQNSQQELSTSAKKLRLRDEDVQTLQNGTYTPLVLQSR